MQDGTEEPRWVMLSSACLSVVLSRRRPCDSLPGPHHVGALVFANCYILAIKPRRCGRPAGRHISMTACGPRRLSRSPPVTVQIALTLSPTTLALRRQTTPEGALSDDTWRPLPLAARRGGRALTARPVGPSRRPFLRCIDDVCPAPITQALSAARFLTNNCRKLAPNSSSESSFSHQLFTSLVLFFLIIFISPHSGSICNNKTR